jgi:hypothetical protein
MLKSNQRRHGTRELAVNIREETPSTKTKFLQQWRFQMLLLILLISFAIMPFFESRLYTDIMATVVLIVAISAISDKRNKLLAACSLLVVSAIAAIWYARWFPGKAIVVTANLLDLSFLALVIGTILSQVFRSRQITRETVAGAICAYLLIGAMWGDGFSILETIAPGSFSGMTAVAGTISLADARLQAGRLSYFSFVTLSTLGYGDITPLTRPARNLAALEAIFGQLYLAVLISRLVSQQAASSTESRG